MVHDARVRLYIFLWGRHNVLTAVSAMLERQQQPQMLQAGPAEDDEYLDCLHMYCWHMEIFTGVTDLLAHKCAAPF